MQRRHSMYGHHALAGERTTIASTALWHARLLRQPPDLRIHLHTVAVTGWAWKTVAKAT
ncbi:MAG: hypothetical protein ABIZ64_03390 [Casimicrobium sp.]